MKIGVPKEIHPKERRVALTPEIAKQIKSLGFEILIESDAGLGASFPNESYRQAGCQIIDETAKLWAQADLILKVQPPEHNDLLNQDETDLLPKETTLISFIWPQKNKPLLEKLNQRKATALAMDRIPRITRAQKLDALSSMASLAGYRAVIEAAQLFGGPFGAQITAAGKTPPAKFLVIGAGVAGLSAIGTARGLGAFVEAFDSRSIVKEQVESLGAQFIQIDSHEDGAGAGGYAKKMSSSFLEAEHNLLAKHAKEADVIITTALVPGQKAPLLITQDMVSSMKTGSIIIDLAAEQGGNCALTQKDEIITQQGVKIFGHTDLVSRMAPTASYFYSNNLYHFLEELGGAKNFHLDLENEIIDEALVVHEGRIREPKAKKTAAATPTQAKTQAKPKLKEESKVPQPTLGPTTKPAQKKSHNLWLALGGLGLIAVGLTGNQDFFSHFTVFILSCFVGWQVIWNVTPALHTPLMSVTNAISGIIIVGGILQINASLSAATWLGIIATFIAMINITGGFWVTHRMLKMFRKQ